MLPNLKIGNLTAKYPIIQGGMGVGISLSSLAGAVAKAGGIGVISAAQPGWRDPEFARDPLSANLRALAFHIRRAKEISNGGIIGVNIMCALTHYEEYVRCCIENGADLIISGAGLPTDLPKYTKGSSIKLAPIVSPPRTAKVLLKLNKLFAKLDNFFLRKYVECSVSFHCLDLFQSCDTALDLSLIHI